VVCVLCCGGLCWLLQDLFADVVEAFDCVCVCVYVCVCVCLMYVHLYIYACLMYVLCIHMRA
jgi:hypothetical protein